MSRDQSNGNSLSTVVVDMFAPRAVAVTLPNVQRCGGGNKRHRKKRHGTRSSLTAAKYLPIWSRLLGFALLGVHAEQ